MRKKLLCLGWMIFTLSTFAQSTDLTKKATVMKVEIWSDVMCPFCYIGKRKFESALAQFSENEKIEVEWKSFQLQPDLETNPNQNAVEHLAVSKGWSLAYAQQAVWQVTEMAKTVGLEYHFNKAVVANSFNAHRLSHYAKQYGKGSEIEEQLFKAYFTEGKNIDDYETLANIATTVGLDKTEAMLVLKDNKYEEEVRRDIAEAKQLRISGVPFFVFNEKYAVSGAQESKVFLQTLEKAFDEWKKENKQKNIDVIQGKVCTPDGECK